MKKNWLTILLSIIIIAVIVYAWASPKTAKEQIRPILSENLVCILESKTPGSPIVYSPDARHVAYVAEKDGKKNIVINGEAGMGYSEIYLDFSVFSPDSTRVAYRAMNFGENPPADNTWFVVIDGEQSEEYQAVDWITFSPSSKHVAYIADGNVYLDRIKVEIPPGSTVRETNGLFFNPDSEDLAFVVTFNGKQSVVVYSVPDQGYASIKNIVFSPDGNHISYAAQIENGWCIVTDGVRGKLYEDIENVVYSPDSNHLAYTVKEGLNTRNRQYFVVLDGEEGEKQTNKISNLTFSPDSNHLVYISEENISISRKYQGILVVDGEKKEVTEGDIRRLVISPDSNRIAYVSYGSHWPPGIQYRIFSDGEEIAKYDFIGDCVFSPDSRHLAYACIKGPKMSVTLNRAEGQEYEILGSTGTTPSAADMKIRSVVFDSPERFHYLVRKDDSIYVIEETLD